MSESLKDLLLKRDDSQPAEIMAIKDFTRRRFNADVQVQIQKSSIVITAPGAALAATLRLNISNLQKVTKTDKRLVIRIG